jgi:hypothetical protein
VAPAREPRLDALGINLGVTVTAAPAGEYFLEIEAHFAMRRNTPFILNAKDWVLMKKWFDDGIPLPVVIEAIDQVFEKNETSGRRKVISSLSYCRHAVKELWEERKELQIGSAEFAPEVHPFALLEQLAAEVEQGNGPPEILSDTASQIRGLSAEKSVPRIEERLIEIEHDLITRLITTSGEASSIRDTVSRVMGDASKLDEKTRARTEEANLRRIVRDRFGLPRMTLFR